MQIRGKKVEGLRRGVFKKQGDGGELGRGYALPWKIVGQGGGRIKRGEMRDLGFYWETAPVERK